MDVNNQLQAPAIFSEMKALQGAGGAPELIWTLRTIEKFLTFAVNGNTNARLSSPQSGHCTYWATPLRKDKVISVHTMK